MMHNQSAHSKGENKADHEVVDILYHHNPAHWDGLHST